MMVTATSSVELPVSVPGVRAVRWTSTELHEGMKERYLIGRTERGRSEWWGRGKVWRSEPGDIQVKQPGDVHRDLSRDGESTWVVIMLPTDEVERAMAAAGKTKSVVEVAQLHPNDERAKPFRRLHDLVCSSNGSDRDRLALEVAMAEAVTAFTAISTATIHAHQQTRPVRRAMAYLHDRLETGITLDDLARHSSLDKFHLCRAFRAQVGLPPHAYLTHLRIARAKKLLREGVRAAEVAPRVGLYDQAQLTRHFRRIVGTTPARFRREEEEGRRA